MPRSNDAFSPELYDRLQRLLNYNSRTGMLIWRRNRGRNARAGDEAGHAKAKPTPHVVVTIDGKTWLAHRIIWFMVTGAPPPPRLTFKDGNPYNLIFSNIVEPDEAREPSPMALYQRRYRRERARSRYT